MAKLIALLAFAALILVSQAAPPAASKPAQVAYIATNIVKNVTKDCPVKNVMFKKEEFDVDKLVELQSTLQDGSISEKCQSEAMQELMTCLTDDSMAVKIGCCSKDCSTGIKKTVDSGCFTELARAICADSKAQNMMTGLTNAGVRCANFNSSCEKIMAEAPKKGSNATSTKAAGAAGAAKSAPAEAPAAPAGKKSSAMHATAVAAVPLAAAAAAILLL